MVDNIGGIGGMDGAQRARNLNKVYKFTEAPRGEDTVELSSEVMTVRGVDNVRLDKIMEIRQQIANGTYVTPEKLDVALDKAIDEASNS